MNSSTAEIYISKPPHACLAVCVLWPTCNPLWPIQTSLDYFIGLSPAKSRVGKHFDQNAQEKSVFLLSDFSSCP